MPPRLPLVALLAVTLTGCRGPSVPNVELRKKNQQLQEEVASLRRRADADAATIRSLQQTSSTGTVATLPHDRERQLFTVVGLRLGRLTGPADLDESKPGDDGLKVYAVPTDTDGEPIKAAGSFVVEATDPAQSPEPLLGRWEFPVERARGLWHGRAMLYEYVLPCPWQRDPAAREARVKVTFTDALTGRTTETVEKRVSLGGR